MNRSTMRFQKGAAALALTLMMAPGLAQAQTKVKSGFNMFSPEQDVEIGRQSVQEANRQLPLNTNGTVNDFVNDVGRKLAANAPGPKFNYEFRVVDASDLNAFALPGGFVYVNRGILEAAKNEGEVAGVMAHEISHAALRHGTHNASKAYLTQAGIGILGGILGGKIGANAGQIINAVGGFGLNALFLKYSRDAETEADVTGAQIMARAGYNPADMANFFDTLARTEKTKTVNWLSSHPAPANRRERILQETKLLGIAPATSPSLYGFDRVRSTLRGLPPARTTEQIARSGSSPSRNGTQSRGPVPARVRVDPPSRSLSSYSSRSSLYQVAYPQNWKVYEEGANGVTIAPPGGAGDVNGRTEIVYGAIISHYEPFGDSRQRGSRLYGGSGGSSSSNSSIDDATNDLLAQLMQSSPHLRMVSGSGKSFRVPEGRGLGAVLRGNNPNTGITERVSVVTRQLEDSHLIYMLFITPEEDAQNYSSLLTAMVNSLKIDPNHRH